MKTGIKVARLLPGLCETDFLVLAPHTQFKTGAKFCNTVVAATSILMPILVLFVFVSLLCSVTNTNGTKIGIEIDVAATTVLQNFATVLN